MRKQDLEQIKFYFQIPQPMDGGTRNQYKTFFALMIGNWSVFSTSFCIM